VKLPGEEGEVEHVGVAMLDNLEHKIAVGRRLEGCWCSGLQNIDNPCFSTKSPSIHATHLAHPF
jgi:hypothetical protein